MQINLTRNEMELVEKSLRFFFCRCDDPKLEGKTCKAFDLAFEFEKLLEKDEDENNEIINNYNVHNHNNGFN
jgi:hypothetical protein